MKAALSPEGFDTLLAFLDRDRERAGEKYEAIRQKLIKHFECCGVSSPEEPADETMDRVARRLHEGEEIRAADPAAYFVGVARNVLREHWARRRKLQNVEVPFEASEPPAVSASSRDEAGERESRLACLERCLARLDAQARRLIVEYYRPRGVSKADARTGLAAKLGVSTNALWIRAHRIRDRLEACVRACLQAGGESERPRTPPSRRGPRTT